MKAFIITLLLIAAGFLAYDRFLTPPDQRIVFKPQAAKPAAPQEAPPPAPVAPLPDSAAPSSSGPAKGTAAAPTAASADGFVPPRLDDLETLTKDWTFIPSTAFPRSVKLSTDVEMKMSVGSTRMGAGTSVVALAFQNGQLTVSPVEGSTARGMVPLDGTDFKEQIRQGYERWKTAKIEAARIGWAARQQAKAAETARTGVDMSNAVAAGGQPVQNADGSYNLLLASIRTGQVTDIRPEKVHKWSSAYQEMVDGKASWLVNVDYEAMTLFGPMDTQARATIQNGKVVRWNYTGSGEEVP